MAWAPACKFGLVLAAFAFAGTAQAQMRAPREAESFQIGNAGAVCEAQGVRLGAARASIYDRKWALLCRDVDTPIGSAYSWRGAGDLAARLGTVRPASVTCGVAGGAGNMPAGTWVSRCRDSATGLDWISYTAQAGDWTVAVEGVAAFDSALRLAMTSLVNNRMTPGTVEIVTTGSGGSLADAIRATGDAQQLIGQGYRRNNAGEYVLAEEFFRPEAITGDSEDATEAERQHEALVNRALQLSNIGRFDEAGRLFAAARALGLRDPVQARLLRNFEAIDSLNQGALASVEPILARPVPDPAPLAPMDGGVDIDRAIASGLNAGLQGGLTDSVRQEARLTRTERAALIDAQALQLRGTLARLEGRYDDALRAFGAATSSINAVRAGRVLSAARLQAQVMSESALAQEARGNFGDSERLLREALALTALRYPETASVDAAKARLAAFLARRGRDADSIALYREVVTRVKDKRESLIGLENQLEPYFGLLVKGLPGNPALADDLFLVAQLIERPGAAQTLAQLSRELSAGSSEASTLFRRANAVDRELARTNLSITQAQSQPDMAALLPDLQERRTRLQQAQLELFDALSAFPAYRSISRDYVTTGDLTALLKPDEAYFKLVRLGSAMYAVLVTPQGTSGWKVDATANEIADLVGGVRDSISLTIGGTTQTYPFDVDSAWQLYSVLLAPVQDKLAGTRHLIFEPDGALLQLPINLLPTDAADVAAYHRKVEQGGDEFDFRGIKWLGRDREISTALSAASFRDARKAPVSGGGKAYIGLGNNAPVPGMDPRPALTRSAGLDYDADCKLPLTSWNQPIPPDELLLAAQLFGPQSSTVITGAGFTDTAIEDRRDLSDFRIVHFATHGLVTAPVGCPAQPALLTSFGGAGSDGLLRFIEVFDLTLDADLVILSACDTAAKADLDVTTAAGLASGGGQALDGLVRAFIGAGGRQVIASHWPAPEEFGATRRLFSAFFSEPPGTSQGAALLAAQHELMDDAETSHPFYWSGFALIGDGERSLFTGS